MSDSNEILRNLVTLLTNCQPSSGTNSSSTGSASASNIVRSLRGDNRLADDVGRVLGSSLPASSRTGPVMPSLHQSSSSGRYVPYGRRKKREPKSYDMKLVLVDFIREVNDTGKTESYDGSVLLDAPFRVRENESDSSIRTRILAIVKSRFPSFNDTVLYASRQGRVVLNLSPCQTLDGKAVYTLKSKSTNNLYVMLSAPAPDRPPPDGDDEEEREHESEVRFLSLFFRAMSVVQTAIFSSLMI